MHIVSQEPGVTTTPGLPARGPLGTQRVGVWLFTDARDAILCECLFDAKDGSHTRGARLEAAEYPAYFRALGESRQVAADDARTDPRTAAIPVVVISADATTASLERLRQAGADAYLTKPLDVDEFLAVVERFLPARAP